MHVHILGIAGTFMAGVAALAKAAGHHVTGSDQNVYPPMSTQLQALGIDFIEGFEASQLTPRPDVVVVGNVMTRGQPVIEALLESDIPQSSGPEWLAREILRGRWVLAVAGTHGKTTTASVLAWILEHAGCAPGFLIGGAPANFESSARLGRAPFFVIEADEYDTAFFDKRAKFVHYRPRTLVLNNLEFDHADIYENVAAIERQFHHLIRTVPASGRILWNAADARLARTLAMGCWTPCEGFAGRAAGLNARWTSRPAPGVTDGSSFDVLEGATVHGRVQWALIGDHNVDNALASLAAARHAGVPVAQAIEALRSFKGVARRMQVRGEAGGIVVYDDFAHHPTAIHTTLAGLRARVNGARIVAVLEPRSQTMRMGVHRDALAPAFALADEVWIYAPANLGWDVQPVITALGERGHVQRDLDALGAELSRSLRPGDHVLVMSNGSFGALHERLLAALRARFGRATDA
ncbi:MAG TPA: UDP-N-acetylmuramate:L-alanyl-gamma-D-glutamyl-meso-diaminopimelate ligase [Steroidobacteraceae bacterium]|jgi:UDP-N-acetylmuramate: L-alanyl-gamma-D-glutamyl-meso-diaminopimelate ligase|nr:UDP-N-acetylmuramate:L-alanyl-gamma-D-glutamyl-meso-diaminopimelate ligase [Steroidobacteraceae bacterium]